LIFTALIGIILPNDKFKGYINLCLGLILILMVLKPLSDFLNTNVSADDLFQGEDQPVNIGGAQAYSGIQDSMMQESLNRQARAQMEGMCADAGYSLAAVNVKANADYTALLELDLTVRKIDAGARPFIYIEPPASEESKEIKTLKNTLSEVYNMSPDNIHISETE